MLFVLYFQQIAVLVIFCTLYNREFPWIFFMVAIPPLRRSEAIQQWLQRSGIFADENRKAGPARNAVAEHAEPVEHGPDHGMIVRRIFSPGLSDHKASQP